MAPVVVIGGGIVGSCVAYFLAGKRDVIVLEKDPSYQFASTTLSAASFRTQFSLPLNVQMSLFGAGFLQQMGERAGVKNRAYLMLATAEGADTLRGNREMQLSQGAKIALFEGGALADRFPWLNTEDLVCGTLGLANEGWFDAYSFLRSVRADAIARGARYVTDEATGIELQGDRVAAVTTAAGERIATEHLVISAGHASGRVAALAGITLPIEPRKRTVFVFRAPLDGSGMPLLFDTSGCWMRPEGDGFIGGTYPSAEADVHPQGNFDPDMDQFEASAWPALAHRVPALEQVRVTRAWAGYYDMCLLDHNAIIGRYPDLSNLIIASGFSGHGVQHGPATGRAVSELIEFGGYRSLDLTPFGYERIGDNRPMFETVVY